MRAVADTAFKACMPHVARALLGEPNKALSSRTEWRFGSRGSLSVDLSKGAWYDNEAGEGGGAIDLVMRHQNVPKAEAVKWLQDHGHIERPEKTPCSDVSRPTLDAKRCANPHIIQTYDYVTADGELLFQVCRMDPKDFRQRKPVAGGGWSWSTKGLPRLLYRLPVVIRAVSAGEVVYVAEGEKGVHALESIGLVGTCSPGGANKWRPEYGNALQGADVVILPDNDEPGKKHAKSVAIALSGIARRIRVLELPGLPHKGDVADWVAKGGTAQDLRRLADGLLSVSGNRKADDVDLTAFPPTEDGIALAFEARFKDQLRFDHNAGSWFEWTDSHWKREETQLAFHWCRTIARELVAVHDDAKAAVTMARAGSARGVEALARSARAFAVTSAVWDTEPFLLGTPDGTVNLRTGQLKPARQEQYVTGLTSVVPAETPECPLWEQFLWEATCNDLESIRFLRAWCGYCLTGDTREHALAFIYGPGGNGKSVFLNTVAALLGDYASTAAMETFTTSGVDKHSTDLAMLRGARLVTASETEEGRPWAEARIKQLTGGDPVTARFMRQDFFTYKPHFKLMIVGNHMPILHSVDDALRRRFNIIGFTHKPQAPDPMLEEKLRAEQPAILRWMIDGCLDWQMNGLVRPQAVLKATAEYFAEQDVLGQFLEARCIVSPEREEVSAPLFAAWVEFAGAAGEKAGTEKQFGASLQKRGFLRMRNPKGTRDKRGFKGLELKPMQWLEQAR